MTMDEAYNTLKERYPLNVDEVTSRFAEYNKSLGYEPIADPNSLPVIPLGTKVKPAVDLPTYDPATGKVIETPKAPRAVKGDVTIEPIKPTIYDHLVPKENKAPVVETAPDIAPAAKTKPLEVQNADVKVTKVASDLAEKLRSEGMPVSDADLATYKTEKNFMEKQTQRSLDLIEKDPVRAKRIAMGEENAPANMKNSNVYATLIEVAKKKGDGKLIHELSRSKVATELSIKGQDIKASDVGDRSTNPVKIIQEVREARIKSNEKPGRVKATKETVEEIKQEVKKNAPKKQDWESFIKSIEC